VKERLFASRNVEIRGGAFYACEPTPWLRLDCEAAKLAGRWVEISYRSGLLEPLTRPVLRCVAGGVDVDQILPGALFGRTVWVGAIPESTTELYLSPTDQCGRFDFEVVDLHVLSWPERLLRVGRREPRRLVLGLYASLVGRQFMADIHFRRALSASPLDAYDAWRGERIRSMDLAGLDAPHFDWRLGPHVRLMVDARGGCGPELRAMVADLRAQPYPRWSLGLVGARDKATTFGERMPIEDGRIRFIGEDSKLGELLGDLAPGSFVAPIGPQDRIPVYMLAALAEAAYRKPKTGLFFGDEDSIDADGRYVEPRLRPDWSEVFFGSSHDLGAALFFKVETIARVSGDMTLAALFDAPEQVTAALVAAKGSVDHIRRVMRTRAHNHGGRKIPSTNPRCHLPCTPNPAVTIIVPTRDQSALLRQCVQSLKRNTALQSIEVLIVDNGSTQPDALRYLAELEGQENTRIISCPGPFNFAKLCNEAAKTAKARTLLFLNNDTEFIERGWLEPLLYWAGQTEIGAVGAKLLYPNGAVQHAGVVLGIDGRAGHFERMLDARDPGYFGRLCAPHEVAAVTGACLAVEKRKFDAVGGFDAVNLMVELNDIDLCLRLAQRGWKCVCAPDSTLVHHESISRGRSSRPNERYAREIQYFRSKWMHKLRDDPYFHPALSLDSLNAKLG
jgi:GT2 family glycosyltransferase